MIGAAAEKKHPPTPDICQCCKAVGPEFPNTTSPFCVRCAARRRCPTQSPLSGYEPVYMPRLYNKKAYVQHNHNCFAYAFDIMDLPTDEECNGNDKEDCKVAFHQPGYASGNKRFDESGEKRCFDLFSRLKNDMPAIEISRHGRPIQFTDVPAKGYSKIALVIDPKQDYHFYRQDSNGFWSHKPGGTPVTNKDSAGRLIYNPEFANRDSRDDAGDKDGLNYNVFCGFMCVPRTLPNRAKRGGGKRSVSTRRGIKVGKWMLPWLRKTQRVVGGMNNTGYTEIAEVPPAPANNRRTSRRIRVPKRITFVPTTVKTRTRRVAPSSGTRSAHTRGKKTQKTQMPSLRNVQKAVGHIFSELTSKYPGVDISDEHKDYILKTLPLYYTTYTKRYAPGKLYGIIRKYFTNSAASSNVVGMFRNANILPERGQTERNPKKMRNYLVRINAGVPIKSRASRSVAPVVAENSYARPPPTGTAATRGERAAARAAKQAAIAAGLIQLATKPKRARKSRTAAPAEAEVEKKKEAVVDFLRGAPVSVAQLSELVAIAEDAHKRGNDNPIPTANSTANHFVNIMADLFDALEEASGETPDERNYNDPNNTGPPPSWNEYVKYKASKLPPRELTPFMSNTNDILDALLEILPPVEWGGEELPPQAPAKGFLRPEHYM